MVQLIHIGYHKTGSTWLQDVFFHLHNELAVVGSSFDEKNFQTAYVKEVRRLVLGGDLSFNQIEFEQNIIKLCQELRESKIQNGNPIAVSGISHEAFCGDWPTGKNSRFIAQTSANCFPDAKVIIMIREQRSMLASMYKQYIRMGGVVNFPRFIQDSNVSEGLVFDDSPNRTHVVEFVKYSRLVHIYQDLFGRENVFVGCIEQLRNEKQQFIDDLTGFLGIHQFIPPEVEKNVQLSELSLSILRCNNRLFNTRHHRIYRFMPIIELYYALFGKRRLKTWEISKENPYVMKQKINNILQHLIANKLLLNLDRIFLSKLSRKGRYSYETLPEDIRNWLENEYRCDNDLLQTKINFDLGKYGYLLNK
jgi:hypothetical protein